ncbi:MAG: hypothetical protein QNJ18_16015 [Xenococcaceae cyanobacterium MO_167.B52]|nr:hypothetical protein [Xenococcaceae cyanobacterium MO_167.B52]
MNIQTNNLIKGSKKVILGLFAISAFGIVALPARADNAVIQESIQESINTGNGNTSIQNSSQRTRIERSSRTGKRRDQYSSGVVQKSEQYCDQLGDENLCMQNNEQRTRVRYGRGR